MSVLKLLLLQIDFAVTFSFVTKLWKRHQSSWISIKTSAFYQVRDFRNFHLMCRHPAKMFDIYTYVHQSYSLLPFLFAEDTAWASRPQFWLYFPRDVAISYRIWAVPTGRGHHSVGNSILVWSWLQGCPLHSCMRNICVISQTLVIFFAWPKHCFLLRRQVTCSRVVLISEELEREERTLGQPHERATKTERECLINGWKSWRRCSMTSFSSLFSHPFSPHRLQSLGAVGRVPAPPSWV